MKKQFLNNIKKLLRENLFCTTTPSPTHQLRKLLTRTEQTKEKKERKKKKEKKRKKKKKEENEYRAYNGAIYGELLQGNLGGWRLFRRWRRRT